MRRALSQHLAVAAASAHPAPIRLSSNFIRRPSSAHPASRVPHLYSLNSEARAKGPLYFFLRTGTCGSTPKIGSPGTPKL